MPRASGQKDYISLVRGLSTESSSLVFPEGYTFSELNFNIDKDGYIRKRRMGLSDLVTPFVFTGANAKVENVHYWRGPSLVCVVVTDETPRTVLRFHSVDDNFTFIEELEIAGQIVATQIADTTKYLMLTKDDGDDPILCVFTESTKQIAISSVNIHIRDFELVNDGLFISNEPATLSDNHKYNLFNSSWYLTRPDSLAAKADKNVATAYFDHAGVYPSNAQTPSVGIIIDSGGDTVFDAKYVEGANFGNSEAPRGHYVYDISSYTASQREARLAAPESDGAPSTTLTSIGVIDFSGTPTFDPDGDVGTGPSGGGGTDPYIPPVTDPGNQIP